MPRHTVEIPRPQPATTAELATSQVEPLAANDDSTRLMTVMKADNPDQAPNRARRHVKGLLPIDALTTNYPDQEGQVLLSVVLSPAAAAVIRHAAEHEGQEPHRFLAQVISRALADHVRREGENLDHALRSLLTRTSPDRLVTAVGRTLTTGESTC
ncbi:hypothetical protein [Streptomyces niveus]